MSELLFARSHSIVSMRCAYMTAYIAVVLVVCVYDSVHFASQVVLVVCVCVRIIIRTCAVEMH